MQLSVMEAKQKISYETTLPSHIIKDENGKNESKFSILLRGLLTAKTVFPKKVQGWSAGELRPGQENR